MKAVTKKQVKQTLYPFRVIVRGNDDGRRVRRVRTVMAADEGDAAARVEKVDPNVLSGLIDPYIAVLPPLQRQQ